MGPALDGGAGFIDIPDAILAAQEIFTDDSMVKISSNAKFGAVRCEIMFMGYYKNGDTVPTPISPVDGYPYSREEILYDWTLYSTRGPGPDFVSGQAAPPGIAPGQIGNIYWLKVDIDDATGKVSTMISYFSQGVVPETITSDCMLRVLAICQRESTNAAS